MRAVGFLKLVDQMIARAVTGSHLLHPQSLKLLHHLCRAFRGIKKRVETAQHKGDLPTETFLCSLYNLHNPGMGTACHDAQSLRSFEHQRYVGS